MREGGREGWGWGGCGEGEDCLDHEMMRSCYSRESDLAVVVRYAVISGGINLAEERRGEETDSNVPEEPSTGPRSTHGQRHRERRGLIDTGKFV